MSHRKFDQHQADIIDSVRKGVGIDRAAQICGVTTEACRQWRRRGERDIAEGKRTKYATFAKAVNAERARAASLMERSILSAATKDWRAGAWYLERTLPGEYGRQDKVTVEVRQQMAAELLDVLKVKLDGDAYSRALAALLPEGSEEAESVH